AGLGLLRSVPAREFETAPENAPRPLDPGGSPLLLALLQTQFVRIPSRGKFIAQMELTLRCLTWCCLSSEEQLFVSRFHFEPAQLTTGYQRRRAWRTSGLSS